MVFCQQPGDEASHIKQQGEGGLREKQQLKVYGQIAVVFTQLVMWYVLWIHIINGYVGLWIMAKSWDNVWLMEKNLGWGEFLQRTR